MSSGSASPELSVVIPALNEGAHLRATVESLVEHTPFAHEIIVVDDGSTDGCADFLRAGGFPAQLLEPQTPGARLGAAQARNKGAQAARGRVLAFVDAHVAFPPAWAEPLLEVLANPSVGAASPAISVLGRPDAQGYGMRWTNTRLAIEWLPAMTDRPYPAPLLPGACLVLRRAVFEECGGFDCGLVRWGYEDAELSFRIWCSGYDLCIVPGVDVGHLFRERHPYAIDSLDLSHNLLRVAWMHFGPGRLGPVIEAAKPAAEFTAAVTRLATGDAGQKRRDFQSRRPRGDDQYFHRFGDII